MYALVFLIFCFPDLKSSKRLHLIQTLSITRFEVSFTNYVTVLSINNQGNLYKAFGVIFNYTNVCSGLMTDYMLNPGSCRFNSLNPGLLIP